MVNSFGFTLDITAMITILQEIIKTLHEKMSKVIISIGSTTMEQRNIIHSLNDRSNEPRING